MLLKFNNIIIRNATVNDAEQLATWWNDGKIMAHAGFPNGTGETAQEIADRLKQDTDDSFRLLIIDIDGIAIGEMNYRNKGSGMVEIGIKICDFSKQNKGIGKILLSMLIASLFNEMGYTKIIISTNSNNKRAQHVYETLGSKKQRINIDSWKDQLGELQSSVDYELCQDDFIDFTI